MRAFSRDCHAYGKENETTPSAPTLGIVEIAPHMSASNKLGRDQIELVGSECEHRRGSTILMAKNETILSATTQDVVEIALHASPSKKLGINQSNGSILLA
jgi:hypothetical protein